MVDQELSHLNRLPLKFNLVEHIFKRLRLKRFFFWRVKFLAFDFFFYFLMRFKKLPNEPRNFFSYFVEVRACGFGIFVQRNALLNAGNCCKSEGNWFNFVLTFLASFRVLRAAGL
jgi:hypothetical protein